MLLFVLGTFERLNSYGKGVTIMHASNSRLLKLFNKAPAGELDSIFHRHGLEVSSDVEPLVEEISLDGANTVMSIFRGWKGVPYLEIVQDVADKIGVEYEESDNEAEIELKIISNILGNSIKDLSDKEKKNIKSSLNSLGGNIGRAPLSADTFLATFQAAKNEDSQNVIEVISNIINTILNKKVVGVAGAAIGVGAAGLGARAVMTVAGLTMPLLTLGMAGGALIGIAGPAYRKLIPTVIQIGMLRLKYGKGK